MSRVYARPAGLVKLEKTDIDELAWTNRALPENAGNLDQIYYHLARSIYGYVKSGTMELQEAKRLKLTLADYFGTVEMLSRSSGRLLVELGKLTAPREELTKMDKAQLINIIVKMEALSAGLIKSADQEPPEFMNLEV
ncbi:MAG: hypothetical protein IJ871_02705 [Ruminococcus sp.]|nr:hypothetical protein [Ruminococcus sp.]